MDEQRLQTEVYTLIERFVQRQQLPLEVIQKFRPYLIDPIKRRPTDKEYIRATQIGHWGQDDEWDYFLHGGGCKLTHTVTGEVIEWDAPHLQHFDPSWFVNWLMWFINSHKDDGDLLIKSVLLNNPDRFEFQRKAFDILEQLHQAGKIRHLGVTRYELLQS
jgi:hypothetical protein